MAGRRRPTLIRRSSAPLSSDGAFDLRIDGRLDAGLANNVLSLARRRVTGAITIAAQLSGTIAKPRAQGSIRLANAEFRDDVTGFKFTGITGAIAANCETVRIDQSTGAPPNGGTLSASGEMRLDPAGGFPRAIRVNGRHAQLVANSATRRQQHCLGDGQPCAHDHRQAWPETQCRWAHHHRPNGHHRTAASPRPFPTRST
jgi:translocation and assembly module TamB